MQLRQYQEGHINWFYTKNESLTIIGGHLGFWQLWWYVHFFRIFHPFCHPPKYMYRGKFCISLIIRSWDKKICIFFFFLCVCVWGGGGGCSLDFHEGQLFVIYLFKSQKAFRMSTLHFPLPQNRYFQKSCAIEEVAVRPNMMADLPILHFRNPWHNSFLEKYRLHCFTALVPAAAEYLWIFV